MKCTHCGTELSENETLCSACGKTVEAGTDTATADTAANAANTNPAAEKTADPADPSAGATVNLAKAAPDASASGSTTPDSPTPDATTPDKKKGKMAGILIAAVAVIAIAAFAAFKMTAKDPKEVVIAAFENIWPEDQVSPTEELFGTSEFAKAMLESDSEASLSLKLDSCSDANINNFAGAGIRIAGKNDMTNKKSTFNLGVTYNDMDAVNINAYFGDNTLMMAIPELVSNVFTLDLSDGLAERVKNSPAVSTYLAQNGVDVNAIAIYLQEMMDEAASQPESGTTPFDMKALMTRYREGCKAQENFKAALVVEKNGNGTFTMDGKEVKCTGYNVTVSKDSMIEFLRVSSDFFLQDETLKNDFLRQLEASVRMSEIMGTGVYDGMSLSPDEMQEQTYEELKDTVDEMITFLDGTLTDMQMVVYVDKAGRLASVDGKTVMNDTTDAEAELTSVNVDFQWNLEGGAYLTQNMNGSITLSNPEDVSDSISVNFNRQGTYDKTNLTDDVSIDFDGGSDRMVNFMYTTSYSGSDGSYHAATEFGAGGSQILKISATGVIDELEKGKSLRITIDELETSVMENYVNVMMSGEYSLRPLQSEVTALEGEQMDILATTPEEWQQLFMEGLFSAMELMQELGIQ